MSRKAPLTSTTADSAGRTTMISEYLRRAWAVFALALVGGGLALPAIARADVPPGFGLSSLGGSATGLDGTFSRQAGAHADLMTSMTFNRTSDGDPVNDMPVQSVRDIEVALPPGVTGDPTAAPTCTIATLVDQSRFCPVASQIGRVKVVTSPTTGLDSPNIDEPLYNLQRPADAPGLFGFKYAGALVMIAPKVRPGDYGISAMSVGISQSFPIFGLSVKIWAVPADPVHDAERFDPTTYSTGAASPDERKPFLTNPTSCPETPQATVVRMDSWEHPGVFVSSQFDQDFDGTPFLTEGCERLAFNPSIDVRTLSRTADAPTGLDVHLKVPQNDSPDGMATAQVKQVKVTLPEGMSVSPSSAAGLGACAPDEIGLGTNNPPTCLASSKIGSVQIDTPVLDTPLKGDVILAKQNDNPFRSLLAVYLVAPGPGFVLKLAGKVEADPVTGRLVTTFDNNPQLPFSDLRVKFNGGSNAPLATPAACGTYTTKVEMTSWASDAPVRMDTPTVIDRGCATGGFAPGFSGGVSSPVAGASSPFTLTFSREDGEQNLSGLSVTLPAGLLGAIKGVPVCPESLAATGTCDPASLVGRTTVLSGPGAAPLSIPQPGKAPSAVYLAGPYKGAPFSLSVMVPAQAGPFDLGSVVVRAALFIDPIDAHVTVVSDPLPTILEGIPLRVRRVTVHMDRAGFMRSPTSCAPKSIDGVLSSATGATAARSARFQVGECSALALKPSLVLTLSGKGQTTDGKHPAVSATLSQPGGQANLRKVDVALPLSLALDPDNANGLCEFVDGSKVEPTCPKNSIVGTATATTPILDEPLSGPVYFVKNVRKDPKSGREIRTLPKLVIPLVGQNGVRLTLTGTSAVKDDQLVTAFDSIPDAPVSSFKLNIVGGKGGILTVSGVDICKATQIADQRIDGQNGKAANADVFIRTPSCPLKVMSKKVGKRSVTVKVGGLGAGKVTVTGKGIKKATKTISKSTVATITAKRTKGKPAKVKVSFDPTGPAKARKTTK
jgi:hypothetical protein